MYPCTCILCLPFASQDCCCSNQSVCHLQTALQPRLCDSSCFWLKAQEGISWAGACVITDSLVPFVRELLGGMSKGPAQCPGNPTHHRALPDGSVPMSCNDHMAVMPRGQG